MGFDYATINAMPEGEAMQFLTAYNEMKNPQESGKKYIVKRKNKLPDLKIVLELIANSDKFQSGVKAGERTLEGFKNFASRTSSVVENLTRNIGFLGNAAAALSGGLVLKNYSALKIICLLTTLFCACA